MHPKIQTHNPTFHLILHDDVFRVLSIGNMSQWGTGFLLLAILLPVWAGDTCNVVRLREYFQLIDVLNKTIQEQREECKDRIQELKTELDTLKATSQSEGIFRLIEQNKQRERERERFT